MPDEERWKSFFDCLERDFITYGTCLSDNIVDFVMLFNILHPEYPVRLLNEAYRILNPGGKVGIIHWNDDSTTPRGPSIDIYPSPEQCQEWARAAGFQLLRPFIDPHPYHYGMVEIKFGDKNSYPFQETLGSA